MPETDAEISVDSADTACKVAHLDVLDTKNHRSASDIHIGFVTKAVLTNLVKKKAVKGEFLNLRWRVSCFCLISHKKFWRESVEVETCQKSLLPES